MLVEGAHLVAEAVSSGFPIDKLFVSKSFLALHDNRELLSSLAAGPVTLIETSDRIMSLLSDTKSPQGVVGIVSFVPLPLRRLAIGEAPLIVIADGIQDPGNLGAIIRVCDAAAADAVIATPGTCNPLASKVLRATAGSIFHTPLVYSNHVDLSLFLAEAGIPLYATDARSPLSLFECDLRQGFALALGNESRGVSEIIRNRAARTVAIPIAGRAESINVAMAASVCLYEAMRQRMELRRQADNPLP